MVALPPALAGCPFTFQQALDAGLTRRRLRQLVEEGEVRRLFHNVYRHRDVDDTVDLRITAAELVVPPHAVVTDRTAAWLWGVDLRSPRELDQPVPLDVVVRAGHKRITRPETRGGERGLAPADVVPVGRLCVTTPLRTALDLGRGLSAYEALAALDLLARAQGVTAAALTRSLPRFRGYRGVVQLRRLVPLVDARRESTGESFTVVAIHDAGLPLPESQVWVFEDGRAVYRLDLAYRRAKVCVEYDGEEFHSQPARREADRRRRDWLRKNGWYVIVVDRRSFAGAALDGWLHELRDVLAARA